MDPIQELVKVGSTNVDQLLMVVRPAQILKRREVSPGLVEVLTYPKQVQKKKQENQLSQPKHLR